jgi:hypothetical protein
LRWLLEQQFPGKTAQVWLVFAQEGQAVEMSNVQ